jgi:histidine phosphotransfer protein HptB
MRMIDWQRVDDLAVEIGVDAVIEVVAMFLEETDEVITRLQMGPSTTDDYHFLKGSALNLGLTSLADLCQQGEAETKAGPGLATTQAQVIADYAHSKTALVAGVTARFSDAGA